MKSAIVTNQALDTFSFAGILGGMGLLFPAYFVPEMGLLALPAFVLLLPGLLFGMR